MNRAVLRSWRMARASASTAEPAPSEKMAENTLFSVSLWRAKLTLGSPWED